MEVRAQLQIRTSIVERRENTRASLTDLLGSVSSLPGGLHDDVDMSKVWVNGGQIYTLSPIDGTLFVVEKGRLVRVTSGVQWILLQRIMAAWGCPETVVIEDGSGWEAYGARRFSARSVNRFGVTGQVRKRLEEIGRGRRR